jgi:hypothetical protein
MQEKSELERLREEAEAKQRGVLWPDMLRSGRTVDEFLWKGDPRATRIQRAGLGLFGTLFLILASVGVAVGCTQDNWPGRAIGIAIGSLAGIAGIRYMRNAFLRVPRQGKNHGASRRR